MESLRIAFAGTPEFALPALNALSASGHRLVGALTQPDRPAGRGRRLSASAVKQRALELGLPVAQPRGLQGEEELSTLRAWEPELLAVVAYGVLLPAAVLAMPRLGCVNIHASLLPRWRGAAPIQRAVLAGDAESGVTIMQLDAGLDTGPILAQQSVPIGPDMTSGELAARLAACGARLLLEVIGQLAAGTARARAQPAEGATYAAKLEKRDAQIDWHAPAAHIARQVNGCNPRPGAQTVLHGEPLKMWRAKARGGNGGSGLAPGRVLALEAGGLIVACGEGELAIQQLQCAGRRALSAADFAHGHPIDGLRFG